MVPHYRLSSEGWQRSIKMKGFWSTHRRRKAKLAKMGKRPNKPLHPEDLV
jgi:hypothetical protein